MGVALVALLYRELAVGGVPQKISRECTREESFRNKGYKGNKGNKGNTSMGATMAQNSARWRAVSVNDAGHVIGEDHHRAKLTDHEVDLLIALRDEGMRYTDLARKFEISRSTAWDICNGRKRGHIATGQKRLGPPHRRRPRFAPAHPDEFEVVRIER